MKSSFILRAALCFAAIAFSRTASAELIYGIASPGGGAQALVTFDSAAPSQLLSSSFIIGSNLQLGESILAIDVRPATGEIYALGSSSRLYRLSENNGVVHAVQAGNTINQFTPALNGLNFGFDFNPTIDRIRVVSETNQNLVLNPITGDVQLVATSLAYGPADPNFGVDPNVVDSAYTNNFSGAGSTQLYGIDTLLNVLVTQANNAGTLGTVGPLGLDVVAAGGFDVSGLTGIAYAALLPANSSQSSLYSISLLTGLATNLGVIDGGLVITALTVAGIPEPATTTLVLCGLAAAACVRRRR
jgi:hypothetical protein